MIRNGLCAHLEAYLDDLSNWYVRRSRRRFWKSESRRRQKRRLPDPLPRPGAIPGCWPPSSPSPPRPSTKIWCAASATMRPPASTTPSTPPPTRTTWIRRCSRCVWRSPPPVWAVRPVPADIKLRQPLAKARVNVGSQREQADLLALAEVLARGDQRQGNGSGLRSGRTGRLQAAAQQPHPRPEIWPIVPQTARGD
jgi:isoleucyl-tRNA synthetase